MKQTAAYLRLSEADDDSTSIAGQQRLAERECEMRGWPAPLIFKDDGYSGSKSIRRPGRDELEARLEQGEFGALIVKSVDRLARSTADFHRIAAKAKKSGCALIVTSLGLDTSTPVGEMVLGILAQIAAFEVAMTSDRVKTANEQRVLVGRALGGPVPYGLKNVRYAEQPGTYRVIDEDEARIVRRIADELLAGHSMLSIARRLHIAGVPTPRGGEESQPWSATAIRRVVSNPAIAGMERRLGGLVRDGSGMPRVSAATAILDLATFRKVEAALAERSAVTKPRTPHDERLLLEGIAVCDGCGYRLRRSTSKGGRGKGPFHNYVCSASTRNVCKRPASVSAKKLEAHVEQEFLAFFGRLPVSEIHTSADPAIISRLDHVREEIESAKARMSSAPVSEIPRVAQQIVALRQTQDALAAQLEGEPLATLIPTGETFAEAFAATDDDIPARRALIASAVEVVVERALTRTQPVAERVTVRPVADQPET